MSNRVKIVRYFWGLTFEINSFNFEVIVFKSTHQDGLVAKMGLNGPPD